MTRRKRCCENAMGEERLKKKSRRWEKEKWAGWEWMRDGRRKSHNTKHITDINYTNDIPVNIHIPSMNSTEYICRYCSQEKHRYGNAHTEKEIIFWWFCGMVWSMPCTFAQRTLTSTLFFFFFDIPSSPLEQITAAADTKLYIRKDEKKKYGKHQTIKCLKQSDGWFGPMPIYSINNNNKISLQTIICSDFFLNGKWCVPRICHTFVCSVNCCDNNQTNDSQWVC